MASSANRSTSVSSEDVGAGPTYVGPAPTAPPGETPPDEEVNPAVSAFHRIAEDVAELKEYAGYFVAAKIDGFKRTLRNLGLYAALGVLGLIAGGAIIATASGLIIVGFASGLGRLFGGRMWLGDIVAGIVVLGIIAGAVWMMMNKLTGAWRSQTIKKYEERKQSQRERFGHTIDDRAAQGKANGQKRDK
jgi:hypothetical protein